MHTYQPFFSVDHFQKKYLVRTWCYFPSSMPTCEHDCLTVSCIMYAEIIEWQLNWLEHLGMCYCSCKYNFLCVHTKTTDSECWLLKFWTFFAWPWWSKGKLRKIFSLGLYLLFTSLNIDRETITFPYHTQHCTIFLLVKLQPTKIMT